MLGDRPVARAGLITNVANALLGAAAREVCRWIDHPGDFAVREITVLRLTGSRHVQPRGVACELNIASEGGATGMIDSIEG